MLLFEKILVKTSYVGRVRRFAKSYARRPPTMLRSGMASICPIIIIVVAAVAALCRRIRRGEQRPLLPTVLHSSNSACRLASRPKESATNKEEFVVVLGTSSGRIASGGSAFVDRGVEFVEAGSSAESLSAAATSGGLSSSPLRTCCNKVTDSSSIADSDVLVQQVTEDDLLRHPQLPRIRVS